MILVSRFVFESSGQKAKYTNWAGGEPNNARRNEDCIHVNYYKFPLLWNDGGCHLKESFVCEQPSTSGSPKDKNEVMSGVWLSQKKVLRICASIEGKSYLKSCTEYPDIQLNQKYRVVITQGHFWQGKLIYMILINGKMVYASENTKPTKFNPDLYMPNPSFPSYGDFVSITDLKIYEVPFGQH